MIVEITVQCERCGGDLAVEKIASLDNYNQKKFTVVVAPCTDCMKSENKAGYTDGYEAGQEEGEKK